MRALHWAVALAFAAIGGFALDLASPSVEWWPGAFIGATLILAAIWQQRWWIGLVCGVLAGMAFWLPHISWLTLYLGPIPWLALSFVMIVWFGLFGLLAAIATRGFAATRQKTGLLILFQSLTVSALWVTREQLQSTWPYGGFAWGRIAHTQADGPLVAIVSWVGFAGFSGLLVWACALVTAAAFRARTHVTVLPVTAVGVVAVLCALSFVPPAQVEHTGTVRIAAVQGNSKSGIFDDRENGDVFQDHVTATEEMLGRLEAHGESVDLIVWPENSGEFQLPEQTLRAIKMERLSQRASAPIVVGSVLQDSDDVFTNSSVVFDQSGFTGQHYDKRRPVPFAEYMPNRAFFRSLVPELVDLVQLDYAFGTRSTVFDFERTEGTVRAGIAICFDIIFDDHAVAMSNDGAELILAQTNNADFGRTDESAQQLQIARLRSVEMGRALVNISTVGTSAIVLPNGELMEKLTPFTADAMVAEVPLATGATPALQYGAWIAGSLIAIGLLGATGAGVALRLSRSRTDATEAKNAPAQEAE